MNTKHIIVVWELIPEETKFYNLVVSQEDAQLIEAAHNDYVNTVNETGAAEWLSEYLADKQPLDMDNGPFDLTGEVTIVHSGFMM
jgi:hypothetical protein